MASGAFNSSPLPTLFLLEALANFSSAALILLYPSRVLRAITHATPFSTTPTSPPSPISAQLLQWLAGLVIALSAPLLSGARHTPRARASRRMVYETLATGELCLVAVMGWQAFQQGRQPVPAAITTRSLLIAGGTLQTILMVRVWIMVFRSEWFEVGNDAKKIE